MSHDCQPGTRHSPVAPSNSAGIFRVQVGGVVLSRVMGTAAQAPLSAGFEPAQPAACAQVAGKQMVGIYLSVWVRRGLLPSVRGVQVTSLGTGLLGYLGNKGGAHLLLRAHLLLHQAAQLVGAQGLGCTLDPVCKR